MLKILLASFAAMLIAASGVAQAKETWVLIESEKRKLHLMSGETSIRTLDDVSIGSEGANEHRLMGSNITPKGEFKIDAINRKSKFRTFYRFNYPTKEHAKNAYIKGDFSYDDYRKYYEHLHKYSTPPQTTSLGGQIGLHGLGGREEFMHRRINWTEGCVAVTDPEIDWLGAYLKIGTKVVVK